MPWTCPAFPSAAALPLTASLQRSPSQQQQQGHKQAGQQMERNGSMLRRGGEQHERQMSLFDWKAFEQGLGVRE
eukprot:1137889-Pelagomonas_calceolata.AAC.3